MTALPGGDLILRGLNDRRRGLESIEALIVSIGAPRLGIEVPDPIPNASDNFTNRLRAKTPTGARSL